MLGRKKQKPRSPGHFDTLVSSKTTIEGDVHFSGGLHIDGKVSGTLSADDDGDAVLRLSEVGVVEGDIRVPHVIINGTVHGDVYSTAHIELAENASINGNVYYSLIEMAMGASVNGSLMHRSEAGADKEPGKPGKTAEVSPIAASPGAERASVESESSSDPITAAKSS